MGYSLNYRLKAICKEGKTAVHNAVNKLIDMGYLVRTQFLSNESIHNCFEYVYSFFDVPVSKEEADRREPNRHGRYRTRAYIVRGAKAYHGNNHGLIHKAVNLKYRVQGDKPSVTRTIRSWQPKTMKGKLFKANARAVNFAVHDVTQTAVDTALAAETVGLKTSDIAQREVRQKLKQKYTREAVDDYHRGVFLMGRTATDAVKGVHNQGFDLSVTVNSNMMGGGMSAGLQGATSHTTKLIDSFAHNLNRLEAALYNIDGRIERTQDNLAKLRLDHAEAQKIVAEPFPQQEELDTKEQRLKVVTDELNQAAIEAKKNAPKREKTCYFERAKMKRDAARLGKKPKTPKDQTKGRSKKQGIE